MTRLTRGNRLLQVLDGLFLTAEARALLVVKPAKLLKNLGMVWVAFKHARVGGLGGVVLQSCQLVNNIKGTKI